MIGEEEREAWVGTKKRLESGYITYLHVVHLELANDLDGHLSVLALQVAGAVYVAEGAVSHLFNKLPALETLIPRKLILVGILFGDQLGDVFVRYPLLCLAADTLGWFDMVRGYMAGLGHSVLGISGSRIGIDVVLSWGTRSVHRLRNCWRHIVLLRMGLRMGRRVLMFCAGRVVSIGSSSLFACDSDGDISFEFRYLGRSH